MSFYLKSLTLSAAFLLALAAGIFLAGWLTLLLLGLHGDVSLDWGTFGQYWRARDLPQFAPYATRIMIVGGVGLGMPLLIWAGLLALLLKRSFQQRRDAARWADRLSPVVQPSSPSAPSPSAWDEQRPPQQIHRRNQQAATWPGDPPGDDPTAQPRRERGTTLAAATADTTENGEMNLKQATTIAALAATAALTACTPKPFPTDREIAARLRDNPARQQKYELTLTLNNAPGSFKYIDAYMYFNAPNCSYLIAGKFAGAYAWPEVYRRFEMVEVSETVWKGNFYTDALLDEDYGFGKVCHWQFGLAGLSFAANGKQEDSWYDISLDKKELQSGQLLTSYFVKDSYPRLARVKDGEKGFRTSGDADPSRYNPGTELFSATLSIRKTP
jgi:hypothetical protein